MSSKILRLAAGFAVAAMISGSAHALPAFSGAQGPGANATGGRGGDVYHVTNLEFDLNGVIPGSLKYGINNAPTAGRTIVFDVGGTIYQNGGGANWWFRSGRNNITVAGQTAPGPGITIAGVGSKWTGDNVILRNVTVRTNKDAVNPTSFTYDSFSLQLKNSIVDHVTATWYSDEGVSLTDAGANTTVQYANISEGLNYASHSFGSIISTEVDATTYSYHHNLYSQNNSRVPRLGSELGLTGAVTSFSNNVVYNWINRAGYSGTNQPSSTNFINNYYIKGNNNGATIFTGGDDAAAPGFTKIFQSGNVYDGNKDGVFNGATVGAGSFAGNKTIVGTAFSVTGDAALDTPAAALQRVLDYTGANWQNRNPIDARIIADVRAGTGSIVLDLAAGVQANEWATVLSQGPDALGNAPFARAAGFDTDQDGMPDTWEVAHNLSPTVPSNNGDFDADGYTNLEDYINELGEWPAGRPIVFGNALGDGRYARIENWDGLWQPSKFDLAVVNTGAVVVIDAVGQHAGTLQINIGGAVNVTSGWLAVANRVQVAAGGTLSVSGGQLFAGVLGLNGGGRAILAAGSGATPRVGSIEATTGTIDLNDNAVIVDYTGGSSLADVRQLIVTARNGGAWNGYGITSSLADATHAVGYAEASDVLGLSAGQVGLFRGQVVDHSSVLVMYTLKGDADLSGAVDIDDFGRLAASFNAAGGWSKGDFDYSGTIDIDDFGLLASNFNQSLPGQRSAVPEPAMASFAAIALLRRRRDCCVRAVGAA